jgi:VanZ family protein
VFWATLALLWTGLIVFFSFQPGNAQSPPLPFPHFDKVLHLLFYGTLTFVWLKTIQHRSGLFPILVACVILLGAVDEIHQGYIPHRDPSVGDWLADVAGALIALWSARKSGRQSAA